MGENQVIDTQQYEWFEVDCDFRDRLMSGRFSGKLKTISKGIGGEDVYGFIDGEDRDPVFVDAWEQEDGPCRHYLMSRHL